MGHLGIIYQCIFNPFLFARRALKRFTNVYLISFIHLNKDKKQKWIANSKNKTNHELQKTNVENIEIGHPPVSTIFFCEKIL